MKPLRTFPFTALLTVGLPGFAMAASVRDFGAKGDGTTDDTAAIQKAVNEAADGEIRFPRGDYRITKTIEVKLAERGRTSLSGSSGAGRVIMAGSGPACSADSLSVVSPTGSQQDCGTCTVLIVAAYPPASRVAVLVAAVLPPLQAGTAAS